MAHFAQLDDNNIVQTVIVVDNSVIGEPDVQYPDTEPLGQEFIVNVLGLSGTWKQCSYNAHFRGMAGIGFTYDAVKDCFIAPQPYPSWKLVETTVASRKFYGNVPYVWEAPISYPSQGGAYEWDEEAQTWKPLQS